MTRKNWFQAVGCLVILGLFGFGIWFLFLGELRSWTEHQPPPSEDWLTDDRLEDKKPPVFDPALVSHRLVEGWQVNWSAVQFKLDIQLVKPDQEPELARLYPSYVAARSA